jgi:uncharacterized protein (TIGR03083 family)
MRPADTEEGDDMADESKTWDLIHAERAALIDVLETLTPQQWATPSLCGNWTVHTVAAHILAGAEQTPGAFVRRFASNVFRFNTMVERDARHLSVLEPGEIIERLRARTTTTNRPPAPVMAMLGEVVVHGADLRQPLGISGTTAPPAVIACLEMYKTANFPVGGKRRIRDLRLVATDVEWSYGNGPEVVGSGQSLLLAMTGREAGLAGLTGEGLSSLQERLATR